MADIESNIRIGIDTSSALASIKSLQSQISQFQREMSAASASSAATAKNFQRQLVSDINATGQFSAGFKSIQSTAESFTSSLEKNKLSMGQYFRYAGASTKTFGKIFSSEFNTIEKTARERVKTLQTQYVSLGRDANGALQSIAVRPLSLDMNDLGTRTAMAAQKQQIFNQLLKQGSTNLLNFGKNTQWAGRQLMVGFTIPLSIAGTMAAKTFMDIEKQAIRFKRVYGDLLTPSSETDAMIDQIKELSLEFTKYGVAVEDTLGLAADAAAMGATGVQLLAQTTEATRLAVLGGVDQQQSLQTTISLQNAFGISSTDLASKIDFLNAVENQTVTAIEDLTIAIPKAAPVIKQMGGEVEDLAFLLTAMKEGGINASEGANALKSGLASLINPTTQATSMLALYGINIRELVESNRGDVSGLVVEFATALDELNPLQRARAIEQLFGKFQFARVSTLFKNVIEEGTQAQKVLELTNSTTADLAALSAKELGEVEQSTTFKFQKSIEDFKASLAPVGEEFLKLVTPLIELGTKVLQQFNNMSDGAKSFITGLIGILGGIAPVFLMTFGLIANGVANAIKGFAFLRDLFLRLGGSSKVLGEQIGYMTQEQLEAAAVAASLDQTHSKLIQTFTSEKTAIDNLTAAYQNMVIQQSKSRVSPIPSNLGKGGSAKKFASGGIVNGPGTGTSDSIMAMLSNGEAVIPAKAVKENPNIIKLLIDGGEIPKFAKGIRKVGSGAEGRVGKSSTTVQRSYQSNVSASSGLVGFGAINPNDLADLASIYMPQIIQQAEVSVDSINKEISAWAAENKQAIAQATAAVNAGGDPAIEFAELTEKFKVDMANAGGAVNEMSIAFDSMVPQLQADLVEAQQYAEKFNLNIKDSAADAERLANALPNNLVAQMSATPGGYGRLAKARQATTAMYGGAGAISEKGSARFMLSPGLHPSSPAYKSASSQEHFSTTTKQQEQQTKLAAKRLAASQSKAFTDGINEAAKSKSPSRKAKQAGKNIADGAIQGIEEGAKKAKTAGKKVTQSAAAAQSTSAPAVVSTTDKLGKMNTALQSSVFAISSLAGAASMADGAVGEVAGKIFQFSGLLFGLMQITQLLTQAKFLELAATRLTVAKQAASFASYGKGIASMSGFIGMIGRAAVGVAAFLGPVGMVVLGLTALAGVIALIVGAQKKQKDSVEGLGNTAYLTAEKMKAAGELLNFEPKTSAFGQNIVAGTAASSSTEQGLAIQDLRNNENFQDQFSQQIEAIKNATKEQAERALQSLAIQQFGAGASVDSVETLVKAIAQEAGQTSLNLKFASINFETEEGVSSIGQAAVSSAQLFTDAFEKELIAKAPQMRTAEALSILGEGAAGFASSLQALKDGLSNNIINAEQFKTQLDLVTGSLMGLDADQLGIVLPSIVEKLGLEESFDGITSLRDQILLLSADAAGIQIPEDALAAFEQANVDVESQKAANYWRQKLADSTRNQATEQENLNTQLEEQSLLNEVIEAGKQDIEAQTAALKDQRVAYEQLIIAGYSTEEAFSLAGNAALAASIASASLAENSALEMEDILSTVNAFLAEKALQIPDPSSRGGSANKSPFQQATEDLKAQRTEITNSQKAYNKLRQAGVGISDSFDLAQDSVLATALATTKVGTKQWEELLSLIKQVDEAARKNAVRDLVKQQAGANALNAAFVTVAQTLGQMGYEAEDINAILSEPALAEEFIKDLEDGKLDAKLLRDYLNGIEKDKKIKLEIQMSTPEGVQSQFEDLFGQAMESFSVRRDRVDDDFQDRLKSAQDIVDATKDAIDETQKSIDSIQTTINEKQRDIEINISRPIEAYQNTIADLQRNIELNFDRPIADLQDESSILSNELTVMDKQAEKINDKYDAQAEALDKILSINQALSDEQSGQLDVADALSKGDIAAAARAAKDLRDKQATQRAEEAKSRLATAQELEIEKLKTAAGLTRTQIEERQYEISQAIFQLEQDKKITQDQILVIQDQIYSLEQLRAEKLLQIRVLEDQVYAIQNGQLLQLQQKLSDQEDFLAAIEDEKQARIDAIEAEEEAWNDAKLAFDEAMQRGKDYIQMLLDAIALIKQLTSMTPSAPSSGSSSSSSSSGSSGSSGGSSSSSGSSSSGSSGSGSGSTTQTVTSIGGPENVIAKVSKTVTTAVSSSAKAISTVAAKAVGVVSKTTGKLTTSADTAAKKITTTAINSAKAGSITGQTSSSAGEANRFANLAPKDPNAGKTRIITPYGPAYVAGGGLMKANGYAIGGEVAKFVSGGMARGTDTVPAMLTPGEFVVRKYAVDKFGTDNLKAINNGTYGGESVYNYSVNVNVKSDANPDQIARSVMTQIKQIDSQRIRSNKF
jgi:TP901 family phage tail tape measure protein